MPRPHKVSLLGGGEMVTRGNKTIGMGMRQKRNMPEPRMKINRAIGKPRSRADSVVSMLKNRRSR
jgi:hypothetical protein